MTGPPDQSDYRLLLGLLPLKGNWMRDFLHSCSMSPDAVRYSTPLRGERATSKTPGYVTAVLLHITEGLAALAL